MAGLPRPLLRWMGTIASGPPVLQFLAERVEDLLIVDHVQSAQLTANLGLGPRQLVTVARR